jgi:hypothetical protein
MIESRLYKIRAYLAVPNDVMVAIINKLYREHGFIIGDRIFLDTPKLLLSSINISSTFRKVDHRFDMLFRFGKQH